MNLSKLKGSWAVVTGASAGIGREFARRLAEEGLNVVLVARRADVLAALAEELRQRNGVRAWPISLDLAAADAAETLSQELSSRDVRPRVLVNNAAVGRWGRFEAAETGAYRQLALVNMLAVMSLCRVLLPQMALDAPSAIVNVSSPAALQPMPYMAAYAASKAFVHSLGLALYEEWRGRGVYVQTLVPGPTATEFDERAGAYASRLGDRRDPPRRAVDAALSAFVDEPPLVVSASGTLGQRIFAALAPTRFMLAQVGRMFRPPP